MTAWVHSCATCRVLWSSERERPRDQTRVVPALGRSYLRCWKHTKLPQKNVIQEINSPFFELVIFELVGDADRHAEVFARCRDACVLADVLPDHCALKHGLPITDQSVGSLRSGLKRHVIESVEHLIDRLWSSVFQIGAHQLEHDVTRHHADV